MRVRNPRIVGTGTVGARRARQRVVDMSLLLTLAAAAAVPPSAMLLRRCRRRSFLLEFFLFCKPALVFLLLLLLLPPLCGDDQSVADICFLPHVTYSLARLCCC